MRVLAILLASTLVLSVAVPQTADACGNPIQLAGNKAVKKVRELENQLRAGKHDEIVRQAFRNKFTDPKLQARADLVFTVAALRLGRDEIPMMWWHMQSDDEGRNATPLAHLRRLRTEAGDDSPLIDARIAEALLRTRKAEDTDEASKILEDLAARDVIPDAEAWASLADVRNRKQDTAGSDAAMAQCKKVARGGRRNPVCKIPAID